MADYYPSAKVELLIRFEEYRRFALLDQQKPKVPTKNLKGTSDNRAPLVSIPDPDAPQGVVRYVLGDKSQRAARLNSVWESKDPNGFTQQIGGIIPKTANWQQNGFRKGDTLKLSFKYADMPFDPRTIRACGVRYYLGNVHPYDYAAGIRGEVRTSETGKSESLNIIPSTYYEGGRRLRSNLRFIGWVNTWQFSISDSSEPMVELDCQDNTTLFINQPAPGQLTLSSTLPVDQAIALYLSHFAQFEGVGIEYRPQGQKIPKLGEVLSNTSNRPPISQGAGSGGDSGNSTTVWDYLTDCMGAIGHMIYVDMINDAPVVVVEESRNAFSNKRKRREDDPYVPRTVDGRTFDQRALIFGVNVLSLSGKHEYTRKSVSGIEVRSYSNERKNILVARYPDKGDRPSRVLPGDKVDDKWLVRHVHGVKDQATLKAIAQNYFNVVGRNELEWEITTKDLNSYGGDPTDPDLLDMRAGDAFEILIDRGTHHAVTSAEERFSSFASGSQYLTELGYSQEFAEAYARAYTDAGFQTLFKLREMSIDWDIDKGVDIKMKGVNFVEVRADPKNFSNDVRPTEEPDNTSLKQNEDEEEAARKIIDNIGEPKVRFRL